MFQRKMMMKQIEEGGVRLGDCCSIYPSYGKKKAFTLNRRIFDLISRDFRPDNLSISYVELPQTTISPFHYRLELEDLGQVGGRFFLKTIKGQAFRLNGLAAKEAYVERSDRLYLDEHRVNFESLGLLQHVESHFEHPILKESNLIASDLRILIEGETGTGKSYLAKKIHDQSGKRGPYVALNISSFNSQLIESELFGHKKGSFTGAHADKIGALKSAHHGTLFLDEIDSLPWELQTKLLTFLDTGSFRRVGDLNEEKVKARLVFASGRKLLQLVEQGSFRRDLYFRLKSGQTLGLQPLRNETKKIKEACQYFSVNNGISMSLRLMDFYESLAWPGNLRQLFGHLEKKKVLSKSSKLDFDKVDEELLLESTDLMSLGEPGEIISMEVYKRNYVKQVLSVCEGNFNLTARKLRIHEKTVRSLLVKAD